MCRGSVVGSHGSVLPCSSNRLIYLHSSDQRQRALADAGTKAARADLARSKKSKKSG